MNKLRFLKKVLFLFVFIAGIIILPVSATAICDYYDWESKTEITEAYCLQNTDIAKAERVIFSNFTSGRNPSFMIFNPNSFEINVFLDYEIEGHLQDSGLTAIRIRPVDYGRFEKLCFFSGSYGNCSLKIKESFLKEPEALYECKAEFTKIIKVCEKTCSKDSDCESGLCNIAAFCDASPNAKKIVPCPLGTQNCLDRVCLPPATKEGGQSYVCSWQCKSGQGYDGVCKSKDGDLCNNDADCVSNFCNLLNQCGIKLTCPDGTQNCNNLGCFAPSSKKYGEEYVCEFQCKSGIGDGYVCRLNSFQKAWIYVIFGIIFAIILFYIGLHLKKSSSKFINDYLKELKEKVELEKDRLDKLVSVKEKIEQEIENKNNFIYQLIEEEKKHNIRIESLNEQIKSAKDIADKTVETEIKNKLKLEEELLKKTEEKISKHKNYLKELENSEQKFRAKQRELRYRYRKMKERSNLIEFARRERLKEYELRFGKDNIFKKSEYLAFRNKNKSKEEYLHVWFYDSHFKEGKFMRVPGYHDIHHIDLDKFNNNIWNLIALKKEDHRKKFLHGAVDNLGDWFTGISEVKKQLGMSDKDFHPEILKKLNEYYQEKNDSQ